jgi:hypothetical protein
LGKNRKNLSLRVPNPISNLLALGKIIESADISARERCAYGSANLRWKDVEKKIKSRRGFLMQIYKRERIYKNG